MNGQKSLPLEAIVMISEYLAGSNAFRTLASLNVASKTVREATLPVLYFAVIWENGEDYWSYSDLIGTSGTGGSRYIPAGWSHTRILILDWPTNQELNQFAAAINPDLTYLALFPKLQIHVTKEFGEAPNAWPRPLRSCLVDVYQAVSLNVFATIQEFPLWWPEHEEDCEFYEGDDDVDEETATSVIANGSSGTLLRTSLTHGYIPSASNKAESANSFGSVVHMHRGVDVGKTADTPHCTCLRLPFDHILEITFMEQGFILQESQVGRPSSFISMVHSDIRIFATWKEEDVRIRETFLSLFRVYECLNYRDVSGDRSVCDILFRGPSIALHPFVCTLPKLLSRNADLYIVLEFFDAPTFSNAQFTETMQRAFDSYMLKLSHIIACCSTERIRKSLFAVEFPTHKTCKSREMELESEIAISEDKSLRLKTIACRHPKFKREVISSQIGRQIWPRIILPRYGERSPSASPDSDAT